jgi:aminobenzoyl-glutamate utilization protein B
MQQILTIKKKLFFCLFSAILSGTSVSTIAQTKKYTPEQMEAIKKEILSEVDKKKVFTQQMVDQIFSYAELGMQEFETSRYITGILKQNGFTIVEGISGIPTAWTATWGSGKPLIAIGSDLDCIPKASQKPGVAYHDPIIEGAPGHGEGHNSGQCVNVTAALVMQKIMQREKMSGTLMLWPGVAEEQLATKAYFVRDGYFKNVDACIFTHVGSNLGVGYGDGGGNGLISVEFKFSGVAAHGAGAPWRGKSALDGVELMNIGWNYKREHLYPTQRSHYVITDGGDQPNVVPSKAAVWYYLRERTYPKIKELYDYAQTIANGAAMMTGTTVEHTILGSAWPGHFNKPIAEAMYENIKVVGLPEWSEADQTLAKAVQKEISAPMGAVGMAMKVDSLTPPNPSASIGGGSDDIADISWTVPTVVLRFPSNIQGLQGHHWSSAICMATPIAHKGATAGAKAEALTIFDMLTKPEIIESAWKYYKEEQTKDTKYIPLISDKDKPAIHLNKEIMDEFRPQMKKFYYDPAKYKNYMEQLGIAYPTLKKGS